MCCCMRAQYGDTMFTTPVRKAEVMESITKRGDDNIFVSERILLLVASSCSSFDV